MVSHGFQENKKKKWPMKLLLRGKVPFCDHTLSGTCVMQDSPKLFMGSEKVGAQVFIALEDLCALHE